MNFGLDYLSAHLDPKGYDFVQFENEAQSPVFNRETGDINNSKIPRSCYRADVHYNDVVIGAYSGGQFGFAEIVNREGLKVTRVDLKLDITPKELISEECTANEAGNILSRKIRNFFLKEGRRVQHHEDTTLSKDSNTPRTHVFGARGSEYQIRIYTKNQDTGQLVRIEFQLRKELARNVWSIIQDNPYNQSLLARAFFSIEATILSKGLLGVEFNQDVPVLRKDKEEAPTNREAWIRTQVLSACLKEFKETGKNLPEILLKDFNAHFTTLMQNNIDYQKISERAAKAERLFME